VLAIATINAAKYVGMEDQLGSIEVGKVADLVLVAGDPLTDVDFMDRIDLVIKEGKTAFDYTVQRKPR
jgi:imidazolonepropionase-like amidohydrolase